MRPTPVGEQIIAQSQRVLEEAATIKDIASSGKDHPYHYTTACWSNFTIGPYLFPNFIPELQTSAPNMSFVIEEGYTSSLMERLRKGEVDVIIVALPFTEADVVVQPLYEESFVLVIPEEHPLVKLESVQHDDLDNENVLLLGEGHCFLGDQVIEAMPNINKRPII